jgi:hypothetical protein
LAPEFVSVPESVMAVPVNVELADRKMLFWIVWVLALLLATAPERLNAL